MPTVRLLLWNIADSMTTLDELRSKLPAAPEGDHWISDPAGERWGAFYLFESIEASEQTLPGRARELIGKDPDVAEIFDLEATVEGQYADEELSRLGLAFE